MAKFGKPMRIESYLWAMSEREKALITKALKEAHTTRIKSLMEGADAEEITGEAIELENILQALGVEGYEFS